MNRSPILALDFPTGREALACLDALEGNLAVKVGMQLFYREGSRIVEQLRRAGHDVFLDLKLHDIPHTVKEAMRVLAALDIGLVNVHAAGGFDMMQAALEGLDKGTASGKRRPALIAVTQLTSTSEAQAQREQLIGVPLRTSVLHYAQLASEAGLDGVVCSVHEAPAIEAACGRAFWKVTPGIRLPGGEAHDQQRIATPEEARLAGATHIVVGRAITAAADPRLAYNSIQEQWKGGEQLGETRNC